MYIDSMPDKKHLLKSDNARPRGCPYSNSIHLSASLFKVAQLVLHYYYGLNQKVYDNRIHGKLRPALLAVLRPCSLARFAFPTIAGL